MRKRRRGHILNITSMGDYITLPGITYYCGTIFPLEGISEALGKEVNHLGIAVTALAPGIFCLVVMRSTSCARNYQRLRARLKRRKLLRS